MRRMTQRELVDEIAGLAEIARKQGPIGLEKVEIEDPFLAKGIRFVADGYDTNFIRDNLERDRDNFLTHLDEGQKIYRAVGDCAPAFGMIGTLIGMVQMFANMTDPSKLGPFMAAALLATFYGAALANLFCLPIADKLHLKLVDEEINRTLIIDGILMIREAKSPTLVREMLLAYLPEKHRHTEETKPKRPRRRRPKRGASERKPWPRRKEAHGGGHGWFVTFADLMGLLVSFFVMLVAFSTQDQQKLQDRRRLDARRLRRAGPACAIPASSRSLGLPTRPKLKNAAQHRPEGRVGHADARTSTTTSADYGAQASRRIATFALAAASLRQALQDMPEITEVSKHIMIEETKQGLNIEIVDQDGRSMFPDGAKEPYERTRRLIQKIAPPLKAMPYRISITGHTVGEQGAAASPATGHGNFPPTAPMRCAKSWRPRACRRARLHGGRQGRHRAAVPRRSLYVAQSPRHHHADARRAAAAGRFHAVEVPSFRSGPLDPVKPRKSAGILRRRGGVIRPRLPASAADRHNLNDRRRERERGFRRGRHRRMAARTRRQAFWR